MTLDIKANSVKRHGNEEPEIEIPQSSWLCPCRGTLKIPCARDDGAPRYASAAGMRRSTRLGISRIMVCVLICAGVCDV